LPAHGDRLNLSPERARETNREVESDIAVTRLKPLVARRTGTGAHREFLTVGYDAAMRRLLTHAPVKGNGGCFFTQKNHCPTRIVGGKRLAILHPADKVLGHMTIMSGS